MQVFFGTIIEMKPFPGFSRQEMEAWLAFLHSHASLISLLDKELIEHHGVSLADYEVLAFLDRSPENRMRMSDLARVVMISPAALTRRVDGLVEGGLVSRLRHREDSRVVLANLTAKGKKVLDRIAPSHIAGVRKHFIDVLGKQELENIAAALKKVSSSCTSDARTPLPTVRR